MAKGQLSGGQLTAVVLLLVFVSAMLLIVMFRRPSGPLASQPSASQPLASQPSASQPLAFAEQTWRVIGAGITAASFLFRLSSALLPWFEVREAAASIGGRALSRPQLVDALATDTAPREFAAWIFKPEQHVGVRSMLRDMGIPWTLLPLITSESFVWTPETGRQAFPALPTNCPADAALRSCDPADKMAYFANTSVYIDDVPDVAVSAVTQLAIPDVGAVVSGFGWQSVVLRGVGNTPVVYNHVVSAVEPTADGRVKLSYAAGQEEVVNGACFTLPPVAMMGIRGWPDDFAKLLAASFRTLSEGVMYLTYTPQNAWWAQMGIRHAVVATSLRIGRVFVISGTELRCETCGDENTNYWTDLLVNKGPRATAAAVADELSQVLGRTIPPPEALSYRAWPVGFSLWTAAVDRTAARARMLRPFGTDVPVFWFAPALSDNPGTCEGAVQSGLKGAAVISAYAAQTR